MNFYLLRGRVWPEAHGLARLSHKSGIRCVNVKTLKRRMKIFPQNLDTMNILKMVCTTDFFPRSYINKT